MRSISCHRGCRHSSFKTLPALAVIHSSLLVKSSGIKPEIKFSGSSRISLGQFTEPDRIFRKFHTAVQSVFPKIRNKLWCRSKSSIGKIAGKSSSTAGSVGIVSFIRLDTVMNCKLLRCKRQICGYFRIWIFISSFKIRVLIKISVKLVVFGGKGAFGKPAVHLRLISRIPASAHCLKPESNHFVFCGGKVQTACTVDKLVDFSGGRELAGSDQNRFIAREELQQSLRGGILLLNTSESTEKLGALLRAARCSLFYAVLEFFAGSVLVTFLQKPQPYKIVGIAAKLLLPFRQSRGFTRHCAEHKKRDQKINCETSKIWKTAQKLSRVHLSPTRPELQSLFQK